MSVNVVSPSTGALSPIASRGQFIQYSVMPTPSVDIVNKIVQYIGTTTANYTNGYFYKCTEVSTGVYNWVNIQVQTGGGGSAEIIKGYFNPADDLFYEESTYVTPIAGDVNSLYLSLDTNLLYRYNGTIFVEVSNYEIGDGLNLDDNTLSADTVIFTGTSTEWNAVVDKSKYDIVNLTDEATGEVVDAVENGNLNPVTSNAVYDGLSLKVNTTAITNPNLLDNPWFTVNQRGNGTISSKDGYIIDRWTYLNAPTSGGTSVTSENGVRFYGQTGNRFFIQKLPADEIALLVDKTFTATVLLSDGTIYTGTQALKSNGQTTYFNNASIYAYSLASSNEIFGIGVKAGVDITVRAVKLELGSVSTLAMDTAPNYASELLKCQRYFVRFKAISTNISVITGFAIVNGTARFSFNLPVDMMAYPTISYSALADWGASNTNASGALVPTSIARQGALSNRVIVIDLINTGITVSTPYILYALSADAYIDFSADL